MAVSALALPLTAVAAGAGTAQASSPCNSVSCLYTYGSSSTEMECLSGSCSGYAYGTLVRIGNGEQFTMHCFFDSTSFTGNYTSKRWFEGYAAGYSGTWLVHSSYVYNQTSVGSCG